MDNVFFLQYYIFKIHLDHRYRTRYREMFGYAIRQRVRQSGVHRYQRAIEYGNCKGNQREVERKGFRIHVSDLT